MEYQRPLKDKSPTRIKNDSTQLFRTLRNIDLNLLTIFEAVYVHKGIVNAAKVLNITPSAISQSIQKLRGLFPDPLFVRKGQGVTPTAYATHLHEYISQGLESILGALDLTGSYDKQRILTLGTTPSVGALVMPAIYQAIKERFPQILVRNIAVNDTENQLSQFQTDLIIDSHTQTMPALYSHTLFRDPLVVVCRHGHPILQQPITLSLLKAYEYTLLTPDGSSHSSLHKRIHEMLPDRQVSFSSYNLFTIASLIGGSDLLGIMPRRFFSLYRQCWPLTSIDFAPIQQEEVEFSLHYNKLSLRDPVLQGVIDVIRQAF
ncbi:LysR family transcriptional regulator [Pseudocitrobacter faecalis]|uniref:YbeF family transcriptional regulator n=1 Tax=Pseudocitrobacter faecalis TaxID=1398493 RepID=UPI0016788B41|nr:YbeF family transcriptional regulator [Pseudocitrobacter faecalis]GHD92518.1 LysR family transcriptional regulator [Pseudocitrobacter faecalis]